MRRAFAQQLAGREAEVLDALDGAADTLPTIAAAITKCSKLLTVSVGTDAHTVRSAAKAVRADLVVITSRQTPVAGDLRLVMAMIELTHHATLIGNQFELIGQQLDRLEFSRLDRCPAGKCLARMCQLTGAQLRKAVGAFRDRDLASAIELEADDDALDSLNRAVFDAAHAEADSRSRREQAFRHMLIARSLERIGDNAVDIARQAAFVMTAELRDLPCAPRVRSDTRFTRHLTG